MSVRFCYWQRLITRRAARVRRVARRAMVDARYRAELPERTSRWLRERGRRAKVVSAIRLVKNPGTKLPQLPDFTIPDGPVVRPGLRVAVILDDFSALALRYEWDQVMVTPRDWRTEVTERRPDLLFVESAWRGNRGAWRLAMTRASGPSRELKELVAWFRQEGIPTVFWNKEDPPNYGRFIETAKLFDHVFTVDADKVPDYRRDLGHDRVGLLPFGAQPRIHNPVQYGRGRIYDVAFAGSYFAEKHSDRRAQMEYLLPAAQEVGLHIYSRMQAEDARYRFPAQYERNIVGTLPYEKMLAASTAYKVFVNVNSVTASPTMCARRLFELAAAQTAVLSGPAASIEPFFGETVTVARSEEEAQLALEALTRHKEYRDRLGLQAHRRVFDKHLYGHRVDEVLRTVGLPVHEPDFSISAVVPTMRPDRLSNVLAFVGRQVHKPVELVLVTHGFEVDVADLRHRAAEHGIQALEVVTADAGLNLGACLNLGMAAASGRYVAKMDDDNYYAPHYLSDLVRVFSYTDAVVAGKWAHYAHLAGSNATLLRFPDAEHKYVHLVQGGTILTRRETAVEVAFEDLPRRVDTTFLEKVHRAGGRVYAADRYNFVSNRSASRNGHTWPIAEQELLARRGELVFYGDPTDHVTV